MALVPSDQNPCLILSKKMLLLKCGKAIYFCLQYRLKQTVLWVDYSLDLQKQNIRLGWSVIS